MDEAPLNNPHDSFIKAGLGEPGQMASFLKAYLPTSLTGAVDWTSLEAKSTDFLDEQLHHRHADLLFSARFGEKPIFFHLLFEHQKSVDSWMPLRLLTYQIRIWENFRNEHPQAKSLPPILPIVFFQDRGEWTPSPQFRDLLALPEGIDREWLDYLPDFQHATINLSGLSLESVEHNLALCVTVKVLRAILEPDPADSFETGLRALQDLIDAPDQHTFLRICLTYLTHAGNTLDRKRLYTIISEVKSPNLKDEAMTIAEQLIKEGRQEGRQEGRREGRQEGRREGELAGERLLLHRQLTRKFGELPYEAQEKLDHANKEELECWGERILDATTLGEVFEG